jgi:RNA-binding protein
MDTATRKRLRRLAHHLHPVVIVGESGLSAGVRAETDRALNDHELIKVKLNLPDRQSRQAAASELAASLNADPVQQIGKVLVLYRPTEGGAPLSNVPIDGGPDARR